MATFTNPSTTAGGIGIVFRFQLAVSPAVDQTIYAATNLPPGLSLNASTGLISGTPTAAGVYECDLVAGPAIEPTGDTPASLVLVITIAGGTLVVGAASGSLDSSWQIQPAGGTAVVANTVGITDLSRTRRSLVADTVTVTVNGRNVDAAPMFLYGSTVTILRVVGGVATPWFVGRVTKTPAAGSGSAESQTYQLSGPWWYLQDLIYRQQWKFQGGAVEQFIGRLILGQDLDGSFITNGAVITYLLQYVLDAATANGLPAPFQMGAIPIPPVTTPPTASTKVSSTILGGTLIPLDEVKDVTCAEVFLKMARWQPDAVAWFDYTTTPPTLHFQNVGGLSTITLTKGVAPLASIGSITPRPDLQRPAVVIHYEVTTSSNGSSQTSIETDYAVAPGVAVPTLSDGTPDPGKLFGALVLTIPLKGESSTTVQQYVQVTPIQDTIGDENSDQSALIAYLAARSANLAKDVDDPNITASGITITACSRTIAGASTDAYDPATGEYGAQVGYDDSLGNELVGGAITADWMASQFNVKAQDQVITFSWTADASATGDTAGLVPQTASFPLKATNAVTQVYVMETSYSEGQSVPQGLAAYCLGTMSALQWEGSVELVEQVAGASLPAGAMGSVLNIAGAANAAWAAMNALIVGEETTASTGSTKLTIGPATHLGPQDLLARTQITRPGMGGRESSGANGTDNSASRSTGNALATTVSGATDFPSKSGGTLLNTPAALNDFTIFDASDANGLAIGVTYGNVNPVGIVTNGDDVDNFPTDFEDGVTTWVTAVTDSGCVWVDCSFTADTTDGGANDTGGQPKYNGCSMGSGASYPTPTATDGIIYLGYYYVANGKIVIPNPVGIGSQNIIYSGGTMYSSPV